MPPTQYTREFFAEWTDQCGIREIQHRYDAMRKDAEQNFPDKSPDEAVKLQMQQEGYKDYVEFSRSCSRFELTCWPGRFGEVGSGFVLYFHMLSLMMLLFAVFFLLQIYPMTVYAGEDYLSGWLFTYWVDSFNTDSTLVCQCIGSNNGLTGPNGLENYGTECRAWDIDNCNDTSCSFTNPGKWVCGQWCFTSKNCPAPLLEGSDVYLSNRVQAPDSSKDPRNDDYRGLVRSYSACLQVESEAAQCTARTVTNIDRAYSENSDDPTIGIVDEGDSSYPVSHGWLSPGNVGPDQIESSGIALIYFACLVVLCGFVFVAYQFMIVVDTQLDADLILPNDFAVMFQGLPVTATDEKALLDWFKKNAVQGKPDTEIVKVVIGWNPGQFTEMIKELKGLKKQLDELNGQGTTGWKSYLSCCFSAPESTEEKADDEEEKARIEQRMKEINATLTNAGSASEMTSSGVVVVVFRFQEDMRRCVRRWDSFYQRFFYRDGVDSCILPSGNQLLPGDKLPKYPIGETPVVLLSGVRAPNPGDIHWEELGVDKETKWRKLAKTNGVMCLVILVCLAITWGLKRAQDGVRESGQTGFGVAILSILPSIGVGVANGIISFVAKWQGAEEYHDTWTSENFSQMCKMAIGMLVNTGLVIFIVNAQPVEWYQYSGIVYDAAFFLIITSAASSLIPLLDIGWFFKSNKRRKLTDARIQEWNDVLQKGPPKPDAYSSKEAFMRAKNEFLQNKDSIIKDRQRVLREIEGFKLAFTPSELNYTRRFAVALKTFMACVAYMPVSPFVSLIGFFAIVMQYWVDKYILLKWAKRPPRPIGRELPLYSLKLIKFTLPFLLTLTTWMFLTPSYKTKSTVYEILVHMAAVSVIYAFALPFNVWTKPFLRCFFDEEGESVDYYQAQGRWTTSMKYHKDQFLYKKLPESVNPEMLSPDTAPAEMKTMQQTYGVALGAVGVGVSEAKEEPTFKGGGRIAKSTEQELFGSVDSAAPATPTVEAIADPSPVTPEPVTIGKVDEKSPLTDGAAVPAVPATSVGPASATPASQEPTPKGKGKGKSGQIVWEFKHGDHFSPYQENCQKFIEQRYQDYKNSGGRDHIDRVLSGKITFAIKFSEPMQSKVTSVNGESTDTKPWVDVRRRMK